VIRSGYGDDRRSALEGCDNFYLKDAPMVGEGFRHLTQMLG
jgi:hypothetical protein